MTRRFWLALAGGFTLTLAGGCSDPPPQAGPPPDAAEQAKQLDEHRQKEWGQKKR